MALHRKIALTIIGFTTVLSITMIVVISDRVSSALWRTLENKGKGVSTLTFHEVEQYLYTRDYPFIKMVLNNQIKSDGEIAFIYVWMPNQRNTIIHTFETGIPVHLPVQPIFNASEFYTEKLSTDDGQLLVVHRKISMPTEGILAVGLKTDRVTTVRNGIIFVFAAALGLFVVGSAVLSFFITKPIRKLYRSAQMVREGEITRVESSNGASTEVREVTDVLNETLQKVKRAEKMAYLGELATSISHEINNPIGIIHMKAELLQKELEKLDVPPRLKDDAARIVAHSKRVLELSKRMLSFARKSRKSPDSFDLRNELSKAVWLCKEMLSARNIAIRLELPSGPLVVYGYDVEIQQVIANLLSNAIDAVSNSDRQRLIVVKAWTEDGEYGFSVRDSGIGIPPENLGAIFEPFFTTKEFGEGSGLGLSICEKIVKEHNGRITVESIQGEGCTFTVVLPHAIVREGV